MKKNVGSFDRALRAMGGLGLVTCSILAPLPLAVRLGCFATLGGYLLLSAAFGGCFGYRLMGRSTCAVEPKR